MITMSLGVFYLPWSVSDRDPDHWSARSIYHELNQIAIQFTDPVNHLGRWVTADDARLNPMGAAICIVLETY